MLEINLLGELTVSRDGERLRLPQSKKTRALLGYLAAQERPVRRERLTALLWNLPDDPKGALRWSLSKLRDVLDRDQSTCLLADRESVSIATAIARIDLHVLRDLAKDGVEKADIATLQAACQAFRGELLEGLDDPDSYEYQAWLITAREEAAALNRRLLTALRDRLAAEPERALPYARRLAELEPFELPPRVELLRLLMKGGHRKEAEEQYKIGSRLLDEPGRVGAVQLRKIWIELRDARPEQIRLGPAPIMPSAASAPAAVLDRPALAVLPFDNMSGDPEQDYLADGITDDLITALSQWRWFPVIARASSFGYKSAGGDPIAFGRALGARYVVQGSIRRAGSRLRITAQLIDALGGHQLWADRYDRDLGDVFHLQDEITEAIVAEVAPEIARVEGYRAQRKREADLTAWDLNLRALAHIHKGGAEDFAQARKLLLDCAARYPNASHPHALLAYCAYQEMLLVWTKDPDGASSNLLGAAQTAVQLDERNWLAHACHGIALMWNRRDYDSAAAAEHQALLLNPSAALAHQFQGCVLAFGGAPREALSHLAAGLKLNPQGGSTPLLLADMALAHVVLGEYESAVQAAQAAISRFSGDVRARQRLIAALGHLGRRAEAKAALEELTRLQGPLTRRYVMTTYPFRERADLQSLISGLEKAGWEGGN